MRADGQAEQGRERFKASPGVLSAKVTLRIVSNDSASSRQRLMWSWVDQSFLGMCPPVKFYASKSGSRL